MSHCSQTFAGIFIEKTRFEEFEEICEQIHKVLEIQYYDKKEINNSNIDLMRKF